MNSVLSVAVVLWVAVTGAAAAQPQPGKIYAEHCAACHGAGRLGGMGPALLPENLSRLRAGEAQKVIAGGRVATRMP